MYRFSLDPVVFPVFSRKGHVCRLARQFEKALSKAVTVPVETKVYRLDREAFLDVGFSQSLLFKERGEDQERVLGDVLCSVEDLKKNADGAWGDTKQVLIEHTIPFGVEKENFVLAQQVHNCSSFARSQFGLASVDPYGLPLIDLLFISKRISQGMKWRNLHMFAPETKEDKLPLTAYEMK